MVGEKEVAERPLTVEKTKRKNSAKTEQLRKDVATVTMNSAVVVGALTTSLERPRKRLAS